MTHTLRITREFDDGHTVTTFDREQPGDARTEHDRLAARWKAAGYDYQRYADLLTLTHVRDVDGDLVIRETVTHIP